MKYRKISIQTTTEAVDYISAMMDELGLEGIQIEDHIPLTEEEKQAMYIDILPEPEPDDGTAIVSSYVDMDTDMEQLVAGVRDGLKEWSQFVDIGAGEVTVSVTDDEDWLNNWKEFFKPFRVTDDIMIKPTWETITEPKEGDLIIEIDPQTAFGTGSHETTRLCIEALEDVIGCAKTAEMEKEERRKLSVLDVGCGSGILSIVAMKLGAGKVRATEIDENALKITWENLRVNKIEGNDYDFDAYAGNLLEDAALKEQVGWEAYDVVVANILADVIIPLSAVIAPHMKKDGWFISSGIIHTKRDEVKEALLSNGFVVEEECTQGDWVSFRARKK